MRSPLPVILAACVLLAGCTQNPSGDDQPRDQEGEADELLVAFYESLQDDRHVLFETDHGTFRVHLYESLMPVTTSRFTELADDGFYDETEIHRNVERFVIQGGDPTGTGAGGSFENIPHERHDDLLFGHGALGLARSLDEDSGDSQWFVTLTPQPHLSDPDSETAAVFGTYSLYGQVVDGMDVVRAINQVPTIPGLDRPVDPPVVERARIVDADTNEDLLGLPRTISDRVTLGDHGVDVDRPLHLFEGHPFQIGVFLRPADEGTVPPQDVQVLYTGNFTIEGDERALEETYALKPVEGDPWSFTGTGLLQVAGEWEEEVRIGEGTARTATVVVEPWHPDYI